MRSIEITIKNESGLHARPASLFTREAVKYESKINLIKKDRRCNAKSIINILSLGISKNDQLTIEADGPDEERALRGLKALLESDID